MPDMLQIWTDGSSGKDRSGGWAYCAVRGEDCLLRVSGHAIDTTNNRMELTGVIQGLKYVPDDEFVEVISDSAYVINCFKDRWYIKWQRSNWQSSTGGDVSNRDLWEELLGLTLHRLNKITWTHVKGHKGVKWNEECDVLAHKARMIAVNILNTAKAV